MIMIRYYGQTTPKYKTNPEKRNNNNNNDNNDSNNRNNKDINSR